MLDLVIDDRLSVVTNHPFLRPICPYIFVQAYFPAYLTSMDQVSIGICGPCIYGPGIYGPGIYGPGIYGPGIYGPGIYGPGIYGPGIKVSRYLGT